MTTGKFEQARKDATIVLFLETVLGFIISIARERGTLLHRTPGTTHTVYELLNFGNFSFHADTKRSMVGGNEVKVWHHPGRQYKRKLKPVLHIVWQVEVGRYDELKFNEYSPWRGELLGLAGHPKGISAMKARVRCEENLRRLRRIEKAERSAKV